MGTMKKSKSDLRILIEVTKEYIMRVPGVRNLLIPTFTMMIIAKFFEVKVANAYKEISATLEEEANINYVVFKYAMILVLSILLSEIQCVFISKASKIAYTLANKKVYKHYMELDPIRFGSQFKGEIQNNISRRAHGVEDIIDVCTLNFFPTFLTVLFVSFEIVTKMGFLTVIIINIGIIVYAVCTVKITKWRNKIRVDINNANNNASNILIDGLLNHETIYSYNNQQYEIERYKRSLKGVEKYTTKLEQSKYFLNTVQRGIWCIISIMIITLATNGMIRDNLTASIFAFFISIIQILIKSLDNFGFMYGKYQQALINIRSVQLLEDIEETINMTGSINMITEENINMTGNIKSSSNSNINMINEENIERSVNQLDKGELISYNNNNYNNNNNNNNPTLRRNNEKGILKSSFCDRIRVENLNLYAREKLLSKNITFEIKKGEKVAIIGKNGVGKSTLLKTMIKILPKRYGKIFIDNLEISEIMDISIRGLISYVSQNTCLFNDTVLYNIKYGTEKINDEIVYELSKKIGLHDSITRLEKGYHTNVGEQGHALSGGERQKVILLRTLLRNSPILVMDEPSAALDKEAELRIFQELEKLDDLTIVTILHNLDLLDHFDKVYLLESSGIKLASKHDIAYFKNHNIAQ